MKSINLFKQIQSDIIDLFTELRTKGANMSQETYSSAILAIMDNLANFRKLCLPFIVPIENNPIEIYIVASKNGKFLLPFYDKEEAASYVKNHPNDELVVEPRIIR